MKRSRFTEEQIIGILRQAETGVRVVDLCRQNGISDATFYKWRCKFGRIKSLMPNGCASWRKRKPG